MKKPLCDMVSKVMGKSSHTNMHTNAQNEEENMEWTVLRDLFKTSYILVQIVCGFLSLHTLFASSDVYVCV